MFKIATLFKNIVFCLVTAANLVGVSAAGKPNVVIMLADDMGFGELSCLNPKRGKIKTPQLDRIAASGMIFTDAHSGSSVCTPTRYGLMTGRYAWRTRLQKGVLTGGKSLFKKDRLTIAKLLKKNGYHSAMIGKWHLGMLFDGEHQSGNVPIGTKVTHGPIDRGGFDEFHGFHHARQMNLWIDNNKVTKRVTPKQMLPLLTEAAVSYIETRKGKDEPFFLYVPWNAPHSPVVPTDDWKGKSGLNDHADFVMQTDDSFGKVYDALKTNGMLENTIVICSSDNGTSAPTSKKAQLEKMGHFPSGILRGSKADIWDGGHRVPFIVSWPGNVESGSKSDRLVCLTDIYATVAEILDDEIPPHEGVDSYSFLNTLKGEKTHGRASVIHHSVSGLFAIRQGNWKLLCCPGSGGWSDPKGRAALVKGKSFVQLYNMQDDLSEKVNLATSQPEKVKELRALLDKQIADGRSTPGERQENDAKVVVDKLNKDGSKKRKKKSKK